MRIAYNVRNTVGLTQKIPGKILSHDLNTRDACLALECKLDLLTVNFPTAASLQQLSKVSPI